MRYKITCDQDNAMTPRTRNQVVRTSNHTLYRPLCGKKYACQKQWNRVMNSMQVTHVDVSVLVKMAEM